MTSNQKAVNPFVKLDEQVTLASSSPRAVRTDQAGRVIGFGCSSNEQQALETLKGFVKESKSKKADADFEKNLHKHIQELEKQILASKKG